MESGNNRLNPKGWSAAHPNEGDEERWKDSPSTETTGKDGVNAQVNAEHARNENTPDKDKRSPSR